MAREVDREIPFARQRAHRWSARAHGSAGALVEVALRWRTLGAQSLRDRVNDEPMRRARRVWLPPPNAELAMFW